MKNLLNNRKQLVRGFRMALTIGIAEFLVIMLLGLFGLWSLVVEIFAIAIVLSLIVLFGLMIHRTFLPEYPIYTPITYLFFPYALSKRQKMMKRVQEEDFEPFVFKEH